MKVNINKIDTERQNENTKNIDKLSTKEMLVLINNEDKKVAHAVEEELNAITLATDKVYDTIKKGGRLIYVGAGTSGRIGVLDASEWLPTYGVGKESVIGLIAGGDHALRHPIESAEDDETASIQDLKDINFNENDILCALASSGRTPYCIGALKYAQDIHAKSISITCVKNSEMAKYANYPIEVNIGQEVITGSTRMKSATAQKMILNMISTTTMIKSGKVYGNLMVDVRPTNKKLIERAKTIIMQSTDCSYNRASELLKKSNHQVKNAIIMELLEVSFEDSIKILNENDGHIAKAIQRYK